MDTSSSALAIVHRLESSLQSVFDGKRDCIGVNKKEPFVWKDDATYKGALQAYQQCCSVLADVVTKFSIVIKTDPSNKVLDSILEELDNCLGDIVNRYEDLAKLDSLGAPLRKFVADSMSGLLYQLLEYLKHAKDKKFQNVNVSTGMIWKAIDDVKNLPAGNKMAHKRFVLSKLGVVKDTIREFQTLIDKGPVATTNDKMDSDGVDCDENDWGSGDDDELYSSAEMDVVVRSVALMALGAEYLKVLSNLMVSVADRLYECSDSTMLSTVFRDALTLGEEGSGSNGANGSGSSTEVCRGWVVTLTSHCHSLEDVSIDLGSELYSPVDDETAGEYYAKMHSMLASINGTLEVHSALMTAAERAATEGLLGSFQKLPAILSEGGEED